MGVGRLGSFTFRLDPESVRWEYRIKATVKRTVGGKVVQVFGTELGDMTVTGSFGVGGWREQQRMLAAMQAIGDAQARGDGGEPLRFLYPPRKWDFLVYLRSFTQTGAQESVEWANENFAIGWTLVLFPIEDNSGIKKVIQNDYIARLAEGIGWKQTKYNGPMSVEEMGEVMGVLQVADELSLFGAGGQNLPQGQR